MNSLNIGKNVTKNKYGKHDDILDIAAVKSTDRLLIVGSKPSMVFMKKYVAELTTCDGSELGSQFIRDKYFDKIFVCDDRVELLDLTSITDINQGLIVFFIENDVARRNMKKYVDDFWQNSDSWDLVSNIGKCVVTQASGYSKYREEGWSYDVR